VSGIARRHARVSEANRKPENRNPVTGALRKGFAAQKAHKVIALKTDSNGQRFGVEQMSLLPTHKAAHQWWRSRFADLVERKNEDGTFAPRRRPARTYSTAKRPIGPPPAMIKRPDDLSRQSQRRLYREVSKQFGHDYRAGFGYGRTEPRAPARVQSHTYAALI
jgi:hypothetical protein